MGLTGKLAVGQRSRASEANSVLFVVYCSNTEMTNHVGITAVTKTREGAAGVGLCPVSLHAFSSACKQLPRTFFPKLQEDTPTLSVFCLPSWKAAWLERWLLLQNSVLFYCLLPWVTAGQKISNCHSCHVIHVFSIFHNIYL